MYLWRHQCSRIEGRNPTAIDDGAHTQFRVDVVHCRFGLCGGGSLRRSETGQGSGAGILEKAASAAAKRSTCHETSSLVRNTSRKDLQNLVHVSIVIVDRNG